MESNWELKDLTLRVNTYGEFEGKMTGTITFANGNADSFTFTLYPDKVLEMLAPLSEILSRGAGELGEKLLESLTQMQKQHADKESA